MNQLKRSISILLVLVTSSVYAQNDKLFGGDYKDLRVYKTRICDSLPCHGEIVDTFMTGELRKVAEYKNGMLDGKVIEFYRSGSIRYVGKMKMNMRKGKWIWYYKSGTRKAICKFSRFYYWPYLEITFNEGGHRQLLIKRARNNQNTIIKRNSYPTSASMPDH